MSVSSRPLPGSLPGRHTVPAQCSESTSPGTGRWQEVSCPGSLVTHELVRDGRAVSAGDQSGTETQKAFGQKQDPRGPAMAEE